jgi:hypothetical protein
VGRCAGSEQAALRGGEESGEGSTGPRIDRTQFGSVTIDGNVFEHDVLIRLGGKVEKRKKKLPKAVYGTSHSDLLRRSLAASRGIPLRHRRRLVAGAIRIARTLFVVNCGTDGTRRHGKDGRELMVDYGRGMGSMPRGGAGAARTSEPAEWPRSAYLTSIG